MHCADKIASDKSTHLNEDCSSEDLLLIRHATTDMAGTLCGHSDPPLNREGRKQAGALASLLQNTPVRRLYSSDLQRAVQTALPLSAAWRIAAISCEDLREISFGDWEGRRWAEIRASFPDTQTMDSSPELCAPRGERFAVFRERVLRIFRNIVATSNGVCTAIVTHLGVIRVVLGELFPADPLWRPDHKMDYCAVYRMRLRSGSSELLTASATSDTSARPRAASEQK